MSEEQSILKQLYNEVTSTIALPYIMLVVGVISLPVGLFVNFDYDKWNDFFLLIANILLVGVLAVFIMNSAQFLGVFRNDLIGIIYDAKFLNKRKDLDSIWNKVTKAMFKSKFPEISDDLLSIITDKYLPNKHICYYKNHESHITIDWVDKSTNIVKVVTEIRYELIAEDKEMFPYPMKSWTNVEGVDLSNFSIELENVIVNGKEPVNNSIQKIQEDGVTHYFEANIEFCGSNNYLTSFDIIKKYSLEKDGYIGFLAQNLIKNSRVHVFHPEDMELCFINRGSANDFTMIKKNSKYLEYQYKGLLLPNQGYIITVKQI